MLDVHRRDNIDVCVQHIHHVLITLRMFTSFDIGMGQFVYEHDLRLAGEYGVQVHLVEGCPFVFELAARNSFQLGCQLRNASAPMCLYNADDYVFTATMAPNAFTQHVEGLAHPWRVAQE